MPQLMAGEDELERFNASFLEAACAARLMIAQLMPTFERLNGSIAYHRDVNARNLLVNSPLDGSPEDRNGPLPVDVGSLEFTILDFGSSTDARAWFGTGEGSWQVENPTGDARYWGPASWVRFLGGPQALDVQPSLLRQYTRRLDIFALAVCTLELMVKLHSVDYPSEAAMRNLPESRGAEVHLAQSVWRAHASWNSYWTIAVTSFDRLAEYSRLSCLGDQAAALQIWQSLCAGSIPDTMSQKLHELCGDLHYLAGVCQQQRDPGSPNGSWMQVSHTLSALLDMMHFNGALEWSELMQRVGPPAAKRMAPPAGGPQQAWPSRIEEAKPSQPASANPAVSQVDSARQQADGYAQAAGLEPMPMTSSSAMGGGDVVAAGESEVGLALPLAAADEPTSFSSDTPPPGRHLPHLSPALGIESPTIDLANCHFSDFSPQSRQRAAPASSTNGEFAVAVPPTFAHSPMQALAPLQTYASPSRNRENFEVYEDPKAQVFRPQPDAFNSPPKSLPTSTSGQSPSAFSNSVAGARVFEHPEEREHEALRILRQVESEVRTLKRWYTEAIEAMRSPNPFPPSEGL